MNFLHEDAIIWKNDNTYKEELEIVKNVRI